MIRNWNDILAHYESLAEKSQALVALRDLVAFIAGGKLRDSLFAWTSMVDLCIVQTEVSYPHDGPVLRVSPLSNGNLEFRYLDTFVANKQWHREATPSEAIGRLISFLGQLHWAPSELPSHNSLKRTGPEPCYPWSALVDAIRDLRPAVRMRWSGDESTPPWEPWIIVPSLNYLETGRVGPVPFKEVEWVEIDPSRRNERGRLVAADLSNEISSALTTASIPFEVTGGVFHIAAGVG